MLILASLGAVLAADCVPGGPALLHNWPLDGDGVDLADGNALSWAQRVYVASGPNPAAHVERDLAVTDDAQGRLLGAFEVADAFTLDLALSTALPLDGAAEVVRLQGASERLEVHARCSEGGVVWLATPDGRRTTAVKAPEVCRAAPGRGPRLHVAVVVDGDEAVLWAGGRSTEPLAVTAWRGPVALALGLVTATAITRAATDLPTPSASIGLAPRATCAAGLSRSTTSATCTPARAHNEWPSASPIAVRARCDSAAQASAACTVSKTTRKPSVLSISRPP